MNSESVQGHFKSGPLNGLILPHPQTQAFTSTCKNKTETHSATSLRA